MRAKVLMGVAFVLLSSFAGAANAAESWVQPAVQECKQDSSGAAPAIVDAESLKSAIFMAGWSCTTVADCPCPSPPACYCTLVNRCICNFNLCCPDGECP